MNMRRLWPPIALILWTIQLLPNALLADESLRFKTEPSLIPQKFTITEMTDQRKRLAPGYLFTDLIKGDYGFGSQIYDMDGTPIWIGPSRNRTQNLHVCDFEGKVGSHLCFFKRNLKRTLPSYLNLPETVRMGYGVNVILDHSYSQVWNFTGNPGDLPINGHAFSTTPGGNTCIYPVLKLAEYDLTPYGGLKKGLIRNGCIHERDIRTRKSLFQWCYLESGLQLWETQTYFQSPEQHTNATGRKFGNGTADRPYDFLHINSIDKTADGDYYICVRHMDQIIKVAGLKNPNAKPGTVLWRFGGRSNNFTYKNFENDPPFSRQHDVRAISVNGSEERFSLFNNGWDGAITASQNYSEGLYIKINTDHMTATMERSYRHPSNKLSKGRGSTQTLPNGNVLVGYGIIPEITEFDANGTVLYHARYGKMKKPKFSYRVVKFPWRGVPHWKPKLVAYCRRCGSPLIAYVSWNGATEVANWKFYTSPAPNGPWKKAGSFPKTGFETKAKLLRLPSSTTLFRAYVLVEAVDEDGNVLSSTVTKTFVPKPEIARKCNKRECDIPNFEYRSADSLTWPCQLQDGLILGRIVILSLFIEAINFIFQNMVLRGA